MAQCSFNQDHPEPRPSLHGDRSLIKRRRRLPRISTPIHPAMAPCKSTCTRQPRGDSFQGCDRSSSSPSPPPYATKENWPRRRGGCAPRGRKDSNCGSRFSYIAAHSPGKRADGWNFRGEPRDPTFPSSSSSSSLVVEPCFRSLTERDFHLFSQDSFFLSLFHPPTCRESSSSFFESDPSFGLALSRVLHFD